MPKRTGKVPNAEKFDASFFRVPDQAANFMDPQVRLFHETTFEAIVDAGLDPERLRGSRTGVYIGWCYSDTDCAMKEDEAKVAEYLQLASSQVSLYFGFKGTNLPVDTACASSFTAFHQAFVALRSGEVDTAIVGGWAIHCRPSLAVCFHELGMISTDGRSKCMDASADGYCRSEAVVSVVLQRRSVARRSYAKVLNARTNTDGFKVEGITFPSMIAQAQLMQDTYHEIGLDPKEVDFVEAHMTGTAAGDPVESEAIARVLCEGRPKDRLPLQVGCLKSNMGHSEGASGLCAITKSCLMFQRKQIPPNIHLKTYNPNINAVKNGQLVSVTEKEDFDGQLIALNCFGFGGCNVHAVIQGDDCERKRNQEITLTADGKSRIPRIVNISTRTREGLSVIKDFVVNRKEATNEFLDLLHDVSHLSPSSGFNFRSSFLLDEDRKILCQEECLIKEKRPLWLFISGWDPSVGKPFSWNISQNFFMLPGVKDAMQCMNTSMKESGMMTEIKDIVQMFVSNNESNDVFIQSFIAYHALQVSLVHWLLDSLEVKHEGVTSSHSGDIIAAFASGVLSLQQTCQIISLMANQITLQKDSDASLEKALENAVSNILSKDFSKRVPNNWLRNSSGITIDCHELSVSMTNTILGKNDALSSGIFDFIPKNAVVMQLSCSKKSMESFLKKGLGPDIVLGQLSNSLSDIQDLLSSLGKDLHLNGIDMTTRKLYQQVSYPVSSSTASLSPLLRWNHDKDWLLVKTPDYFDYVKCNQPYVFDLMDPRYQYLGGHVVDGRILLPATGYLWLVWDILAHILGFKGEAGKAFLAVGVEFRDVHFERATILPKSGAVTVNILLLTSTGQFCVTEGGTACVSGFIRLCNSNASTSHLEQMVIREDESTTIIQEKIIMQSNDIYKELRVRGYDYGPTFQGLVEAASDGSFGKVKWMGNWVSFTDSLLQLAIIGNAKRDLYLPTYIEYLKCDIKTMLSELENSEDKIFKVDFDSLTNTGCCRGLYLKGLKASPVSRRSNQQQDPIIESYDLIPYNEKGIQFDRKDSQFADEYNSICRTLVQQLISKIEGNVPSKSGPEKESISKFFGSNEESDLIAILHELVTAEDTLEILQKKLAKLDKTYESNPLVQTWMKSERMIRHHLDIVLENVISDTGRAIDVVEVIPVAEAKEGLWNQQESPSLQVLNQLLAAQPTLTLSYQKVLNETRRINDESIEKEYDKKKPREAVLTNDHLSSCNLLIMISSGLSLLPSTNDSSSEVILQKAMTNMTAGSFILMMSRSHFFDWESDLIKTAGQSTLKHEDITETAKKMGFKFVSSKQHSSSMMTILLRKPFDVVLPMRVIDVAMESFSWVTDLKEVMAEVQEKNKEEGNLPSRIWLRAVDSQVNGLIGMMNSLRREVGGNNLRSFFAPGFKSGKTITDENGNEVEELIPREVVEGDLVMNVMMIDDKLGSYRYTTRHRLHEDTAITMTPSSCFYLDVTTKGDLSSFKFYDNTDQIDIDSRNRNNELFDVYYSSLNFKDVMIASGRIPVSAYPSDEADQRKRKSSLDSPDSSDSDHDIIPDNDSGKGDEEDDLQGKMKRSVKRSAPKGNLGMEFSGRHRINGTRVMGMLPVNGIASCVSVDKRDLFIYPVIDSWTLEEAATIPVVYFTCYYALFIRGNIVGGETVLIHAGSGGVGQAAINVCLSLGCKVFTTVGTEKKRGFIQDSFPQIPCENILNSRDVNFEEDILRLTNGYGVDIVLNSLAEDKLRASMRLLAPFGRFLEIGKYDIVQDHAFDRASFTDNQTFHAVCVAHLIHDAAVRKSQSAIDMVKRINSLIQEGISNGQVQPIKRHVFSRDKIEEAFRFMSAGKHIGKVLIKMRQESDVFSSSSNSEDENEVTLAMTNTDRKVAQTLRRTTFDPEKVYIVTGGLGGFGLELGLWLVMNGARKLVLTSRSGIKTPYQKLSVQRIRQHASLVVVSNQDVSDLESCKKLVDGIACHGPIGGVFHLAMVLSDSLLENQTEEKFMKVCGSKAKGGINLDIVLRNCDQLDHFVCFSSIACGRGNIGQSNYSFANSCLERVCEKRKELGLPGLAIQWGAVGDVGVVAEAMGGNDIVIGGSVPQRIPSCLAVLDQMLQCNYPVMSSLVLADMKKNLLDGKEDLLKVICHVLGVKDSNSLTNETTLGDLGMDSLMAVEIRQGLERDYDIVLSATQVRQLTIKEIKAFGGKKKKVCQSIQGHVSTEETKEVDAIRC